MKQGTELLVRHGGRSFCRRLYGQDLQTKSCWSIVVHFLSGTVTQTVDEVYTVIRLLGPVGLVFLPNSPVSLLATMTLSKWNQRRKNASKT